MRLGPQILTGIAAMTFTTSTPVSANDDPAFDRAVAAVQERMELIDAENGRIPGRAIVMVRAGGTHHIDARGTTRMIGGQAVTEDTPFYIASMTKAFVGLMAVRLDEEGVLPLDTTLAEVFPDMKVDGVDLGQLTMRRLLSHQLGFRTDVLSLRTAYTDRIDVADYAAVVSTAGVKIDEEFRYSNQGPLLYAAALEVRTGRSWRAWIEDTVFDPLDMQHSSARTSDFAEVSHSHFRSGGALKLHIPKRDEVMHAAGGLVVSPSDMAGWLSANTGEESGISLETFAAAQSSQVDLDMRHGPIHCTGYAFGWRKCTAFGLPFLEHGGSYTGMRSQMVILPEQGVAFAGMFNSDSMTGGLGQQLTMIFMAAYAGQEEQMPSPDAFATTYSEGVDRLDDRRVAAAQEERADNSWGGWTWQPGSSNLLTYTGEYDDPALGILEVALVGDDLRAWINTMPVALEPAQVDLFGATLATDTDLEPLLFERNEAGVIVAANFLGRRLVRREK